MTNILKELYYGNLEPIGCTQPKTEEYQEKNKQYAKSRRAFEETLKTLNPELFRTFAQLCSEHGCLNVDEEAEAFQLGFCLGVAIMQEAAQRIKELI